MLKANIIMKDRTELKEVLLFKSKGLGNSEIKSKAYAKLTLNGENQSLRHVYICGKYIQGGIIPQQIESYELIDDEEEVKEAVLNFIKDKNIDSLNYLALVNLMMENREEIISLLK